MARYDTVEADDAKNEQVLIDKGFTIVKLTPEETNACKTAIRKDVWPQLESTVGKGIAHQLYDAFGIQY